MTNHVMAPAILSTWPLVALAAMVALNELLALAGLGRVPAVYSDTVFGLALVAVTATLGRRTALVTCTLIVAYVAAVAQPFTLVSGAANPVLAHFLTISTAYYVVVLLVAHYLQRFEAQHALMEEAQALARVGNWEWDLVRKRVAASKEAYRLFGLPEGSPFTLQAVYTRMHPDDQPRVAEVIESAIAGGRDFDVSYRVVTAEGTRDIDATARLTLDASGRLVRMTGTIQDVTAHMEAERAISLSHERLVALDQMKDDFISSVSHELRTPLTSVKGYLEFLADEIGGPLSPAHHEYVAFARTGAARLERLVDDLLDFALLEAGEFRLERAPIDVVAAASRVHGMLGALAFEREVTLTLEAAPDAPLALADEARVEQILINLVGNAVKFTPGGGRVTVRISALDATLRIDVADTGPGLPPEAQARLFEKFYRLRRPGDVITGTGLGLAIAKHLVEAHGGTIGVISAPGLGSTFWFTLPQPAPASQPATGLPV